MTTVKERLLSKTHVDDNGCWVFTGCLNSRGYGCISNGGGKVQLAHRVSYELHRELIPDGMTIDHLCRNKQCVNPEHLEIVTRGENTARRTRGQTHCKRGHELAGDNLFVNGRGFRSCRECSNAARRVNSGRTSSNYWASKRAAS